MKRYYILICLVILIAGCLRENNQKKPATNSGRFIKIEITDKYLKDILLQYSKMYDFDGKGVIMTTIKTNYDTTRYFLDIFLDKDFFDEWLANKNFVLYDTIDNRIVILATKLESYYSLPKTNTENDTILNRYFRKTKPGLTEIWQLEYTRVGSLIKRKVIYDFPF